MRLGNAMKELTYAAGTATAASMLVMRSMKAGTTMIVTANPNSRPAGEVNKEKLAVGPNKTPQSGEREWSNQSSSNSKPSSKAKKKT